jgi:hypothetical protein
LPKVSQTVNGYEGNENISSGKEYDEPFSFNLLENIALHQEIHADEANPSHDEVIHKIGNERREKAEHQGGEIEPAR